MINGILKLFKNDIRKDEALRLYTQIVKQARIPEFYNTLGVPDSPTGRFDMVALHSFLVIRRLRDETVASDLVQALSDTMFTDMDSNLREMGVGDLSVGKSVKALASHYFGLTLAYESGLEGNDDELRLALYRNLYAAAEPTPVQVDYIIDYIRRSDENLMREPISNFETGRIKFAPLSKLPLK